MLSKSLLAKESIVSIQDTKNYTLNPKIPFIPTKSVGIRSVSENVRNPIEWPLKERTFDHLRTPSAHFRPKYTRFEAYHGRHPVRIANPPQEKASPSLRRLHLLDAVPSAPGRVGRVAHVTVRPSVLTRLGYELVPYGAVLVVLGYPISNMLLQLAPAHAALPAESLAAYPQSREVTAVSVTQRVRRRVVGCVGWVRCLVPRPLQLIGAISSDRQRNRPMHASVNRVKMSVGQTKASRVNGIQLVEDGEMELRRQCRQRDRTRWGLLLWWHWLIVHN